PPTVVLAQNSECVARTSNWLAARRCAATKASLFDPERARSVELCSLLTRSLLAIGKARITQTRSDGKNTPVPHVLHERDLTQTLYDRVVVHQTIVSCGPIFGID